MPRGKISLDMRSCGELGLTITVWCSGCNTGTHLPTAKAGPKITDAFRRLRCRRCGSPPKLLTVSHRLKGGSLDAEVLRLEQESPATSR